MIELIFAICLIANEKTNVRVITKETLPLEETRGTPIQTWLVTNWKTGNVYRVAETKCTVTKVEKVNV